MPKTLSLILSYELPHSLMDKREFIRKELLHWTITESTQTYTPCSIFSSFPLFAESCSCLYPICYFCHLWSSQGFCFCNFSSLLCKAIFLLSTRTTATDWQICLNIAYLDLKTKQTPHWCCMFFWSLPALRLTFSTSSVNAFSLSPHPRTVREIPSFQMLQVRFLLCLSTYILFCQIWWPFFSPHLIGTLQRLR